MIIYWATQETGFRKKTIIFMGSGKIQRLPI